MLLTGEYRGSPACPYATDLLILLCVYSLTLPLSRVMATGDDERVDLDDGSSRQPMACRVCMPLEKDCRCRHGDIRVISITINQDLDSTLAHSCKHNFDIHFECLHPIFPSSLRVEDCWTRPAKGDR